MEKVRLAVIGVGGMGHGHCTAIKEVEEVELVAVSDIDEPTAKEVGKEFGVEHFTDWKELIKKEGLDAVLVATPHYFHPEISVAAMEEGLHCLSEKPIAVAVSEADRMVEAAKRTKRVFSVMYQKRSEPAIIAAKNLIKEGRLGEIQRTVLIDPWYRSQAYYDSGTWRATWVGEGGGVLINQAPHGMDLFMLLGGLPAKVEAKTRTKLHKIEVEDEACALLEYENGAWGYYYTSTTEVPDETYMEICGDKGKLLLRGLKGSELQFFSLKKSIPEYIFASGGMWSSPEVAEEKLELQERETGHSTIIRNFARAILHGEELLAPGEEGLWSVEFINALILSGKKGKPVEIPVDREEYDQFLEELKKTSKAKVGVKAQRVTDTQFQK